MVRPSYRTNWEIYTINNKIAVDYILRFEKLSKDLEYISEKLSIPINLHIRAKSDVRDREKTIREYYDKEAMGLVESIYHKEINYFGYEPPFKL